jgi:hypothetical protein
MTAPLRGWCDISSDRAFADASPGRSEGEPHQFRTRGNANFVENLREVIAHGIRADSKLARDVTIRESFCKKRDHLQLARTKQFLTLAIHQLEAAALWELLQNHIEFPRGKPEMTLINLNNTPAEELDLSRFDIENSPHTQAKQFREHASLRLVDEYNELAIGISPANASNNFADMFACPGIYYQADFGPEVA